MIEVFDDKIFIAEQILDELEIPYSLDNNVIKVSDGYFEDTLSAIPARFIVSVKRYEE